MDSRPLCRARPFQCLSVFLRAGHQVVLLSLLRDGHELLLVDALVIFFVALHHPPLITSRGVG